MPSLATYAYSNIENALSYGPSPESGRQSGKHHKVFIEKIVKTLLCLPDCIKGKD
jgi:hypothetical protein